MIPHILDGKAKKGELVFLFFLLGCGIVLWHTVDAVLLFFAATLVGTFLSRLSDQLRKIFPSIPENLSILIILFLLALLFAIFMIFMVPGLYEQFGVLAKELPQAMDTMEIWLRNQSWFLHTDESTRWSTAVAQIMGKAGTIVATIAGGIGGVGVVLVLGVFFALNPVVYKKGILLLFRENEHKRLRRIFDKTSETLWLWLLGRGVSMIAVAVLTTIGLMILGMPLALTLGLIAGLLSFIPNFGPLLSVVPATLLGMSEDPANVYLIPSLYVIVQVIEGNFITPFVEQNMVHVPAGVVIMAQVICAMLFGTLGLLMATPLAVTTFIVIQEFYVRDVLGNKLTKI